MTCIVLPFTVEPRPPATGAVVDFPPRERTASLPFRHTRVGCQTADEAHIAARLLLACAAPRLDRLDATAMLMKREGQPYRALVVVHWGGLDVIASADAMRRIAVNVDFAGRQGAALDLLQACDQAEALADQMQRSHH